MFTMVVECVHESTDVPKDPVYSFINLIEKRIISDESLKSGLGLDRYFRRHNQETDRAYIAEKSSPSSNWHSLLGKITQLPRDP